MSTQGKTRDIWFKEKTHIWDDALGQMCLFAMCLTCSGLLGYRWHESRPAQPGGTEVFTVLTSWRCYLPISTRWEIFTTKFWSLLIQWQISAIILIIETFSHPSSPSTALEAGIAMSWLCPQLSRPTASSTNIERLRRGALGHTSEVEARGPT